MIKSSLFAALLLSSLSAIAAETQTQPSVPVKEPTTPPVQAETPKEDLILEGARWWGEATGYTCASTSTAAVEAPESLAAIGVTFLTATTDFTLDNGLLKATFVEGEESCSYSALILADNAAKTLTLVDSRAFSLEGGSCAQGKAVLDETLAANDYIFTERQHQLTILVADTGKVKACGEDATEVGIGFKLKGKL